MKKREKLFVFFVSTMCIDLEKNLKTIYIDYGWTYNIIKVDTLYHDCADSRFFSNLEINPIGCEWFWTVETELKLKKGLQQFYKVHKIYLNPRVNGVYLELDYKKRKFLKCF